MQQSPSDEHAFGFGIHLVFWFGAEFRTPARDDSVDVPDSAEALESRLTDDLPPQLKEKLIVVVLDVSRPQLMIVATGKRRKKSPSAIKSDDCEVAIPLP